MERGKIKIKNETLAVLNPYLLTRGIPLPPGAVKSAAGVSIVDRRGRVLPSAGKILQRRPDGSVEWMLMDILLKLGGQENTAIYVVPQGARQPAVNHPVTVAQQGGLTTLSNGISSVTVSREDI